MAEPSQRFVKIELETRVEATRSTVYRAITAELGAWWPHRFRSDGEVYHEGRVGGTLGERWPDGGGVAYGTIMWLELDTKQVTSSIGVFGDYVATNTETLIDADGATIYRKSLHLWGDVSEEMVKMFREGSRQLMEQSLKAYCERVAEELR